MQSYNEFIRLITLLMLTALASGCANITNQQESGFLKSYEGFVDMSDPDYTKVYRDKDFTIEQIGRAHV